MTALLHESPNGFRNLAHIEQFTTGDQLCATMIGGAIHIHDLLGVSQGVVKVIK